MPVDPTQLLNLTWTPGPPLAMEMRAYKAHVGAYVLAAVPDFGNSAVNDIEAYYWVIGFRPKGEGNALVVARGRPRMDDLATTQRKALEELSGVIANVNVAFGGLLPFALMNVPGFDAMVRTQASAGGSNREVSPAARTCWLELD